MVNKLTKNDIRNLVNPETKAQEEMLNIVIFRADSTDPSELLEELVRTDAHSSVRRKLSRSLKFIQEVDQSL